MERIAPLAKILAEANGIEWQQLKGTGVGGMIIEQDILDYLSRVMSGEAEPPSTPVDLPPPDWDGNDVPGAGMFDANLLSQAGVESDIADFVQQSRPAAAPAPTPTLSQDDFELDDAEDDDLMAPEVTSVPAAVTSSMPTLQNMPSLTPATPSIPVAPMPTIPAPATPSIPSFTPAAPQIPAVSAPAPQAPAPQAPASQPSGGLTGLLSRLYHKDDPKPEEPKAAPAPSFTAPSAPEVAPVPSLATSGTAPSSIATPAAPAAPFSLGKVESAEAKPTLPEPVAAVPTVSAPVLEQPTYHAPAAQVEPVTVPAPEVEPEPQQPAPRFEEREEEPVEEAVPAQVVVQEEEPQEEEAVTPAPEPTLPTPAAPITLPVSQGAAQPGQAVWFGTYLRREAQVAQLHELRDQLSEALEREVPLTLLVARAAQRHAVALGLETVALRDMERGSYRQMGGQVGSSVSLRDALIAVDEAFDGQPDLLVVDAGALDMDDLHYPETLTLSVGRVQDGRASLSLQGEVDQEKAARFLASVAQTLEKPVILLV